MSKDKKYISDYHEMMDLWSNKNTLDPSLQTAGSAKKAFWVCKLNHEWEARILNVKHGSTCPVCSGRKVVKGINDFSTTHPELAKRISKNSPYSTEEITSGSNKKLLWDCKNSATIPHEFEAEPYRLVDGRGCGVCAGKVTLKGVNDIITTANHLLAWWDYKKNIIDPTTVSKGSHKKVWWKCNIDHSFEKPVVEMNRNPVCGYCSGKVVLTGYNDMKTLRPDFLDFWDYKKNDHIDPSKISVWNKEPFYVKCKLGHSWETNAKKMSSGYRCPYCGNAKILIGYNDLATKSPKALLLWSNKNTISPYETSYMSGAKVWWKCKKGHEWKACVSDVSSEKSGCPVCSNRLLVTGYNDLATKIHDINNFWSSTNTKTPSQHHSGSAFSANFICPISQKEFSKKIYQFVESYPFCVCNDCTRGRSKFEKEVKHFTESKTTHEVLNSDRKIIPPYELDIVIPDLKLAFECNGDYWHSDEVIFKSKGISAYDFHLSKKNTAYSKGYELYFIWEDDWKNNKENVKKEIKDLIELGRNDSNLLNRFESNHKK